MGKTIYLHVGMPKTGTSALQTFLYENSPLLEKQGLYYPQILSPRETLTYTETLVNFRKVFTQQFLHNSSALPSGGDMSAFVECWTQEYLPVINASSCDNILFSEEIFWLADKGTDIIQYLKDNGFNVKIIVYLRKVTEYIASIWGETVKSSKAWLPILPQLKDQEAAMRYSYGDNLGYDKIQKYINIVGKDNVIVRPFEKCQWYHQNLIEDFLHIFGLPMSDKYTLPPRTNESYNRNDAEFSLMLHRLDLLPATRRQVHDMLINNPNKSPAIIETLSDETILEITNRYKPIFTQLAKIYGKNSFFKSDFPDCYGKKRSAYDKVSFSLEEMDLLHQILSNHLQTKLYLIRKFKPWLTLKYHVYSMLCRLAPKKAQKKWQERKEYYEKMLAI